LGLSSSSDVIGEKLRSAFLSSSYL